MSEELKKFNEESMINYMLEAFSSMSRAKATKLSKVVVKMLIDALTEYDIIDFDKFGRIKKMARFKKAKALNAKLAERVRNKEITRKEAMAITDFYADQYFFTISFKAHKKLKEKMRNASNNNFEKLNQQNK